MGGGDRLLSGRAAVFLDRDGVITEPVPDRLLGTFESPYHPADVEIVPGAVEGIRALREAGWLLIGVSNQPAAAKGNTTLDELHAVDAEVRRRLAAEGAELDDWRFCFHHPNGTVEGLAGPCDCRKPAPGMLLDAARTHGIDLAGSWMVGDSDTDVQAGQAAGCATVLIGHPRSAHRRGEAQPDATVNDLENAAVAIASYGARAQGQRVLEARMLDTIKTKLFADGADLEQILERAKDPRIGGFTTNPTLMWKAGLTDYADFAQRLLAEITDRPISFEVFADDESEIRRQALMIAGWGDNVYVKIPVTTTDGTSLAPLIKELSDEGVKLNVTALMTTRQVETVATALSEGAPSNISVFAGRIADAGVDPIPIMRESVEIAARIAPKAEIIWASPRELLNLVQANDTGCHIITMTDGLLAKLGTLGTDLDTFSLETVRMFRRDAVAAGFSL